MSIKDRLKTAYENIALNGDETWTESTNTFQEANKKLYSREHQLNSIRILEERPRTVKDSIPDSKLATYADFEYNEARELCYTQCIQKTQFEFLSKSVPEDKRNEPWLLPDVDSLFIWFLCCQDRTRKDCATFEACSEHGVKHSRYLEENEESSVVSPLLEANGFQEKKLRMTIISDKIKLIWEVEMDSPRNRRMAFSRELEFKIDNSSSIFFPSSTRQTSNETFLDDVSEAGNEFDHLKDLSESFSEQKAWISNCRVVETDQEVPKDEPAKRLYSAVLQGLSPTESVKKVEASSSPNQSQAQEVVTTEALPSFSSSCTTSISSVTVLHSKGKEDGEGSKLILKQDVKIQKNMSIQANVKIIPKLKVATANVQPKIVNAVEDSNQRCVNQSIPFVAQPSVSYVNNYNYQFNSSHYTNTYQNSCGCTNTFSHTSQVITNRNMQSFQRQNTFMPGQYQYAQPVLMLQQNRTSVYPLSQPVQPPYYYQPLQQTRVMQRWIVPQNYSRSNQQNFTNAVQAHFAAQNPQIWINPQQQAVPSTSQFYTDPQNRFKTKLKKSTQPQISIYKSKVKRQESLISAETDSDAPRPTSCSNSAGAASPPTKYTAKTDLEEVVTKTVNLLFEDETHVPVTSSLSEELEIQALEQYCNSTDNVYQELERQAAEQYNELSGNLMSPPTRDVIIGGLKCFFTCSIDVNV